MAVASGKRGGEGVVSDEVRFMCAQCGHCLKEEKPYLQLECKCDNEGVVYSEDLFCCSGCLSEWLRKRSYMLTDAYLKALCQIEDALRILKGPAVI